MFVQVGALILATSLIQLANGFFTTLVSLRLHLESFNPAFEGLILSAYFIGFTVGSVVCGGIIQRIGHIRGYAAFGGIVIGAAVGMSLFVGEIPWALLRAAVGFGCVGLFVATESWLNAKSAPAARGKVFSIYMVGTFLALGIGQLLVGRLPLEGGGPINIIVVLFAIALVTVAMTRAEPPPIVREVELPYGELSRKAPLAVMGSAIAGMITACVYAVVPAWMLAHGISQHTIGLVMLSVVLGGLALQVPVGLLSDRMDRRLLICILAVALAVTASALAVVPRRLDIVLPLGALLGGLMSTIYPVSVSLALDKMAGERVVAVSGRLILVTGLGSTVGPFVGNWIMAYLDLNGMLYFLSAAAAALAAAAGGKALFGLRAPRVEAPFGVMAPQALQPVPESAVAPPLRA